MNKNESQPEENPINAKVTTQVPPKYQEETYEFKMNKLDSNLLILSDWLIDRNEMWEEK